jgi:glutamate 5-kinase
LQPRGSIRIDAGAVRALLERGRSLLPIGVLGAEGRFVSGDLVRCVAESGEEVARGLCAYSFDELEVIKGHPTSRILDVLGYSNGDEVIHRDNLVIL